LIDSNQVDGSFNKEPNHEWNVIEISGKFYFIDCNLGSGFIDEKDEFNFNLNPLYFLTPAEFYIDDHFPIKSEWQLLDKEISKITFEKKNFYKIIDNYNEIFKRNIHLINETLPVIFYDGNENINNYNEINLKFSCPKRDIYAFLKFKSCKNFNNNCTIFSKTNWEKSKNNNFNNFNTGANYSSYNKKNNEITDINFERLVFLEKKLPKNNFNNIIDNAFENFNYPEKIDEYDISIIIPYDGIFSLNFFEIESIEKMNINYKKSFEYIIEAKNVKNINYVGYPVQYINESKINYKLNSPKNYYLEKNTIVHFSITINEDVSMVSVIQDDINESLSFSNGVWEKSIKVYKNEIILVFKLTKDLNTFSKLFSFATY